MIAPAQNRRLVVGVLVGMALSPSFTGLRPALAQPSRPVARPGSPHRTDSPDVRGFAAMALGGLGPAAQDAVPALVPLLKDPKASVRRAAASALGGLGPAAQDAVPALVPLLNDPEADVQWAAAVALDQIGPRPRTPSPPWSRS